MLSPVKGFNVSLIILKYPGYLFIPTNLTDKFLPFWLYPESDAS